MTLAVDERRATAAAASPKRSGRQRRAAAQNNRVRRDGKFFRIGTEKFYVKGVTYGPFAPNADGDPFPSPGQAREDFEQILELAAQWGEIDRSHRKLAHRGSYLYRVWVSPASVYRVLVAHDLVLPKPAGRAPVQRQPWPDWLEYRPNQVWGWDVTHFGRCRAAPGPGGSHPARAGLRSMPRSATPRPKRASSSQQSRSQGTGPSGHDPQGRLDSCPSTDAPANRSARGSTSSPRTCSGLA